MMPGGSHKPKVIGKMSEIAALRQLNEIIFDVSRGTMKRHPLWRSAPMSAPRSTYSREPLAAVGTFKN